MTDIRSCSWVWEETDASRSGGAGDLAKLFKNEEIASPGVMASAPPPAAASLLAREVIQNSWDASVELRDELAFIGEESPPFKIAFDFETLRESPVGDFASAIDLDGLSAQFNAAGKEGVSGALGLARSSAFALAGGSSPELRLLKIHESGTTGMYGPFVGAASKMYLALVSLGYTVKGPGSGGSYGYGKAGLIAGSATRTVFAYSCFSPRLDDKDDGVPVTRRLLGMTYWGQHSISGSSFTGFARFGDAADGWVKPLVNEAADEFASRLGLTARDPDNTADLGTSFVLLDPVVEAEDLQNAIERNWWAAIEEGRFTPIISEQLPDGTTRRLVPRPKKNPATAAFVRAYELATVQQDNDVPHEASVDLGQLPPGLGSLKMGKLGLVADLEGWSYAQDSSDGDESAVEHTSLIALLRGPLMTVEYFQPRGTRRPPYIRGALVADEAVDDLLRQSEPKAHNAWVTSLEKLGEDVDDRAPRVAQHVLRAAATLSRRFQERLKPAPPDASHIRLTVLADLFKGLARGGAGIPPLPPPPGDRDLSIGVSSRQVPAEREDQVCMAGAVKLRLADHYEVADRAAVRLRVSYRFMEDERAGEACNLAFDDSIGVPDDQGWVNVEVDRDMTEISFVSEPYDLDWTGRLAVSAEIDYPILEEGA